MRAFGKAVAAAVVLAALTAIPARAEYNRIPESTIDLGLLKIDESQFLGKKVNGEVLLTASDGTEFRLKEKFGKPMVLVLSYFTCDGVCSAVNADLKEVLKKVDMMKLGKNFNVVTISFDKYESPKTTAMFMDELGMTDRLKDGWTFAVFKDWQDIKKFTDNIGFKYFWSPRDATFFHPNAYIIVSPEGRVTRYLYSSSVGARDLEVALFEASSGMIRPNQVINLLVSYCYSYNYKLGKYTLNIPIFVGLGALGIGVSSFLFSVLVYKKNKNLKS